MAYLLTPYTMAQMLTGVIALIISILAWRRRDSRGGWPLFLLFVAVTEWALANGLEAAAVPPDLKIFWSKVGYIGAQISPSLLFLFALQYTGKGRRVKPVTIILLFIVPLMVIFLAATNDVHGLIWVDFLPGPAGTNSLIYRHGPAFWLSMAYIFSIVAISNALLLVNTIRSQRIYRRQNWLIIVASFIPWAGSILYTLGLNPFPGLDVVSISFLFTGSLILFGMSSSKLLDLVPIANEFVLGGLANAVLVVDERFRLVDFNTEAAEIFSLDPVASPGTNLFDQEVFQESFRNEFRMDKSSEVEMKFLGRYFNVHNSPLTDQTDRFIGWAIILDDITRSKNAEIALEKANTQLQVQLGDIRELQNKLEEQVVRDSLTGVFNRRYLDETLSREIAHAARSGYPLSLIMMDVDHFKKINDQFGHKTGDEVMKAIARILQEQTRDGDCVSRYGGDEFLLVMPEMGMSDAIKWAEQWREDIKERTFQFGEQMIRVTISNGIATYPENGHDVDMLTRAADDAMYQAKGQGRDRTVAANQAVDFK